MKTLRCLPFLLMALLFSACASQPNTMYTTVAAASLQPGEAIPAPTNEVILTVSGAIGTKNSGDSLVLDMATLEKFGLVEYAINDPWLKEKVTYQGVLMSDFLKMVQAGSTAEAVHIVALDGYEVDISIREINKWPVLLSTRANGNYMTMNENGPTRIVFPFDQYPELDPIVYRDLSIWNIVSLEIR